MEKTANSPQSFPLKDLIDIPAIQDLIDSFSQLSNIAAAILDRNGEILAASAWRKICTDFHRKNPVSAGKCHESDTILAERLGKGEKYNIYKCKNGLVDVATPIIVDDVHVGNLFIGQFLLESPDLDFFAKQADTYGFDKAAYLDALKNVPVLTSERIKHVLAFFSNLTVIIATTGKDRKNLFELNQSLQQRVEKRTAKLQEEIQQRKQTELKLQRRAEFEQLAAEISSELAGSTESSIDLAIDHALEKTGVFTGADRAYLFQFSGDGQYIDNTHEWCAEGVEPQLKYLQGIAIDKDLPWFAGIIKRSDTVHIPDVSALPPEAGLERKHFETQDIRSLVVVPMLTANELNGFLGFDAVTMCRTWSEDDQNILRFIGETIGVAIERNRAEEALHESEMRWQFALEGAGDGVWDWDMASDRVYFSPRWKKMLGYNAEEIDDNLDDWNSRLHPDDRTAVHAEVERHRRDETPVYQSTHRLRCKDGSYKWILARGKIISRTKEGKPLRIIGTHTDISEIKKLEAEHTQLISELKQALARVKQLNGLLPICSFCKKIRDDKGYWKQIETYIMEHSDADFSHSVCQDCAKKYYPGIFQDDD